MPYSITLTAEDVQTIQFVGHRYGWSHSLRGMETGTNEISEADAWEIREGILEDTEGGHSLFPMLDHHSDLASNLLDLLDSIV